MKTYMSNGRDRKVAWYLVDATDLVLGRMAARIATVLMGKHLPTYTPHMDTGDFVIVTNAEKVKITGRKSEQKVYRHHTGWIGNLVEEPYLRVQARHPDRIIRLAVRRMLPKTKLGSKMFKKLKVYAGPEHPHAAQVPVAFPALAKQQVGSEG